MVTAAIPCHTVVPKMGQGTGTTPCVCMENQGQLEATRPGHSLWWGQMCPHSSVAPRGALHPALAAAPAEGTPATTQGKGEW